MLNIENSFLSSRFHGNVAALISMTILTKYLNFIKTSTQTSALQCPPQTP